ncbi:MAG: LPS-assembly protein LptD [Gallionella sp.]
MLNGKLAKFYHLNDIMRFRFKPVVLTLLYLFAYPALAETARARAKSAASDETVFMEADKLRGDKNNKMEAVGNAILRKSDQTVHADRLLYDQRTGDAQGLGSVVLDQAGSTLSGPYLKLNLNTHAGYMKQPQFYLKEADSHGSGEILHIQDKQHYTLEDATYTTCPADQQDWFIKMTSLEIDRSQQVGTAHHAWVEFMGVPFLYTPWMNFPLNDKRKSGFLAPIMGGSTQSGSEITLPYYWNIAPNMDATIAPRMMLKRGVMLTNEFRYRQAGSSSVLQLDVLPNDVLAHRNRIRIGVRHQQVFAPGLIGQLNYNQVSDNAYYRDLSNAVNVTSKINLLQDASLSYAGGWWNSTARLQHYQTLQNPAATIGVPYARLPQVTINAAQNYAGAHVSVMGEYVSFSHPERVNAQRFVFIPSVSYPLIKTPGYYLTPKFTLHTTQYLMGKNNTALLPNASRVLPMISLDSGATFERNVKLFGKKYLNTLEPRAFYVYVPYKNQDALPVFDSGQAQFSFSQMFTENRLIGNDRVGDANQVTVAVISRFLGQHDGDERLKVSLGERFSFKTPKVNLVAPTTTDYKSDILMAASGHLNSAWSLNSEMQYTPGLSRIQHYNVTVRYRPEAGKVLNLGYRFVNNRLGVLIPNGVVATGSTRFNGIVYPTIWGMPYEKVGGKTYSVARPASRQINISGQWPLYHHLHAVGQWNYSFLDKRLLSGIVGLEYTQSCWTLRLVAHSFTVGALLTKAGIGSRKNTGIFLQLELNNFLSIGSNPLSLLRKRVPGYTKLQDKP